MATEWTCPVCTLVNSVSVSKCGVCDNPRRANPERARRSSILSFHQEVSSPPARKKKASPSRSASSQCSPTSQSSAGASLVITLDDDSPKPAKLKASTPTAKKKPQGRKRLRKSTSSDEGSDGEESELELTQEEEQWAAKQKGGKGKGKGGAKSTPPKKAKARKPPARKARKPKDSDSSSSCSSSGSGSNTESDDAMDVGVKASAKAPIRRVSRGKASGGGGVEVIELEEDEDQEEKEQGGDEEDREEGSKPSGGSKPSRGSRVKRVREEDDGSDTDGSDLLAIDVAGVARGQRGVDKGSSSGTRALAPVAPVQVVSSPVRRPFTAPPSTASPMVLDLSEGPGDTDQAHEATGADDEGRVVEVEVVAVVRRQTADDPLAALLEADANGWDGQTHLHVKRPRTSTQSGASATGLHAWHPLYRTTDALPPEVLAARRPSPSTANERDREEGPTDKDLLEDGATASPRQAPPPPVSAVPSFKMTLGNDEDEEESDEDEEPVRAQPDKGQAQGTREESKTVKKEPVSSPPLSTQEAAATLKTLGQELDLPPQQPMEPSSHSNGLLNLNGPAEWACSHCTYMNISDVDMCQMCESARDKGKAEGKGEWKHEGPTFETEQSSLWHHDMEDPGGMEHDDDDMGLCPEGSFSDDNFGDEDEEDLLDEYGDGEEEWEEQGDSKPRAKHKTEVCDLTVESSGDDDDEQDSGDDVQDFDDEEPSVVRRGGPVPPDHDFLPHFRSISRAMAHGGLTVNFDEMLRMDDVSVAGYDKRRKSREARDSKKKGGRRKKGGGKKRAGGGNKFWQRKRAKT